MAKLELKAGTTSKLVRVFVQDSSVTTGAGLTGLVFNTANLQAYYIREGAASMTQITLVTMTVGTWVSGGFKVVDATNAPGLYELGLPDAAIAAGAKSVVVYLFNATNMVPCVLEIELTAVDNQNANNYGLGVLPASAVPGAASGLFIAGTNAPVTITGSGDALTITSSGGNGNAINASGNGTGAGLLATGGATGVGISGVGGATSGAGIKGTGSAGNSAGVQAVGQGSAAGLQATGGATGAGVNATGGATSGAGIAAAGAAGNSAGISAAGFGTGSGLSATSGAGATGDGITATAASTNGNGVNGVGTGTGKGLKLTGGNTPLTTSYALVKNTALTAFPFVMTNSTTGVPQTGLTVTATRSLDGAAFGACANSVTELSNGVYLLNLAAGDLNGNTVTFRFTATGANDLILSLVTQS